MLNPFAKKTPDAIARKFGKQAWACRHSEEALADVCVEAATKLPYVSSASRSELQVTLDLDGGPKHCMANLHKPVTAMSTSESEGDCWVALLAFLNSLDEIRSLGASGSLPLDVDSVVPLVRPSGFANQSVPGSSPPPASFEFADGLCLLFAEDRPNTFRFLREAEIDELGQTPGSLLATALSNMQARMAPMEIHSSEDLPLCWVSCGGNFEASLLLAYAFWADMSEGFEGTPIAAAPAGDLLAFADSENADAVSALRSWVASVAESPELERPLSFELFRFNSGQWDRV